MRLLFSLFILLGAPGASADAPKILVFGDSLSAGYGIDVDKSWTALLQSRLKELGYEHQVVNASISGETTEGGVARIDAALSEFSPVLLIIELGANDGLRGFPPQRIKANLETMVERAKEAGTDVVLLGIRIPPNYGARYSKEFEAVFSDVASNTDTPWIRFFMRGIALNDELLLADRLHPNAAAQPILLENAWPEIRATIDP